MPIVNVFKWNAARLLTDLKLHVVNTYDSMIWVVPRASKLFSFCPRGQTPGHKLHCLVHCFTRLCPSYLIWITLILRTSTLCSIYFTLRTWWHIALLRDSSQAWIWHVPWFLSVSWCHIMSRDQHVTRRSRDSRCLIVCQLLRCSLLVCRSFFSRFQ